MNYSAFCFSYTRFNTRFQVKQQISPIQLAKIEQSKRIRARGTGREGMKLKPESDW